MAQYSTVRTVAQGREREEMPLALLVWLSSYIWWHTYASLGFKSLHYWLDLRVVESSEPWCGVIVTSKQLWTGQSWQLAGGRAWLHGSLSVWLLASSLLDVDNWLVWFGYGSLQVFQGAPLLVIRRTFRMLLSSTRVKEFFFPVVALTSVAVKQGALDGCIYGSQILYSPLDASTCASVFPEEWKPRQLKKFVHFWPISRIF